MKVSVIIPVYNKEEYIGECLMHLLQQDFDGFEVICVDDGSTDNSGRICGEWAAKDARISVTHTENRGVTAARRRGVELAQGQYIIFADADDRLQPGALRILHEAITRYDADEVIGRFVTQHGAVSPMAYEGVMNDVKPLITDIVTSRNVFPVLWGLICKKKLVANCLDTPREIIEGEDLMMQVKILMKQPKVCFICDCVYYYNAGLPNTRKRTLAKEQLYDTLLRQVLEPEWEKYKTAYVFHQIKQYEEFIIRGQYEVRKAYYQQVIPSPLPKELPLLRRIVWSLPPQAARVLLRVYRRLLALAQK